MDIFLIYIIGVIIFTICIYCNEIHNKNYMYYSKKQLGYKALKTGWLSWLGIFITFLIMLVCLIIYSLEYIDNWINKKLA